MAALFRPLLFILFVVSSALQADSSVNQSGFSPHDYSAVYQVKRNGKQVGEITISLSHQGDIWTLHGYTHDMRGLAKVLKIKGSQTTTGKWTNGKFQPENFDINFSLIGYKTGWTAEFNWSHGVVTTRSKDELTQLSLAGGATDPFSLSLNISALLTEQQTQMTLEVIDEDTIDSEIYAAEPGASTDSALGCLQIIQVNRIRENKKRRSMIYYAIDYDYLPVLMHHSKKKGNKLELQIISLNFDGKNIESTDSCAVNAKVAS